jgi:hypothetical protein
MFMEADTKKRKTYSDVGGIWSRVHKYLHGLKQEVL